MTPTEVVLHSLTTSLRTVEEHQIKYEQEVQATIDAVAKTERLRADAYSSLATDRLDPQGLANLARAARREHTLLTLLLHGLEESYRELSVSEKRIEALTSPTAEMTVALHGIRRMLLLHADVQALIAKRTSLVFSELTYANTPDPAKFSALQELMQQSQDIINRVVSEGGDLQGLAQLFGRFRKESTSALVKGKPAAVTTNTTLEQTRADKQLAAMIGGATGIAADVTVLGTMYGLPMPDSAILRQETGIILVLSFLVGAVVGYLTHITRLYATLPRKIGEDNLEAYERNRLSALRNLQKAQLLR